jgi:hypothetical protein
MKNWFCTIFIFTFFISDLEQFEFNNPKLEHVVEGIKRYAVDGIVI